VSEPNNSGFRLAHTMIRVVDLEASLKFYCDILGLQVLRRTD
jgi:lactoylglutathione lyase